MSSSVSRQGFWYDTGDVTLALNGTLAVAISNPANSGKKVIIESFAFMNQVSAMMMTYLYHQPGAIASPTTVSPIPYILDTDISVTRTNVGVVTYGSAMTGGTQLAGIALQSAANTFETPPLTLLPGVTLGIKVTAAVAGKIGINLSTREESA